MDLGIPCETPSTRGPGRGLVRDNLKELRQGKGDETRAIRALYDWKAASEAAEGTAGGQWRLPWTATRQKTPLKASEEPTIAAVTIALLLSRLAQQAMAAREYKRASSYLAQGFKVLQGVAGGLQADLSAETLGSLRSVFSGLAHEVILTRLLEGPAPSRANAAVHARVAMYAQDMFSAALQECPKPLRGWVQDHRDYCLAVCHLMVGHEQAALGAQGVAIAHLLKAREHAAVRARAAAALAEAESANRLVAFQPVPSSTTLPAGRCVVDFSKSYF